MRSLKSFLSAILLISSASFADYEYGMLPSEVQSQVKTSQENPVKVIQSAIIKLNQLTAASTYSPQMVKFLVNQDIIPMFDFNYIATAVLSAAHANLETEEVVFFTDTLRKNILTTLLLRLSQGHAGSLEFVYARPTRAGSITVKLYARNYSRFGFNVELSLHKNKLNQWQIFDVALDHDSMLSFYKRMVTVKVRKYGVNGMLGRI